MSQRVLVNIGQIIILNLIYIVINVISLGLLTIPSTSTLFHYIGKMRRHTYDPYDTLKPFMKLLVKNTKEMIGIQIIFTMIIGFSLFNIENMGLLNYPALLKQTLLVLYTVAIVESTLLIVVISYLKGNYILNSRLDLVKMSFYLIHRHILTTLIIALILFLVSYVLFVYSLFIALFGLFTVLFYLIDFIYKPVCQKHIIEEE